MMTMATRAVVYEHAQCARLGSPADWDSPGAGSCWQDRKLPRHVTALMAAELCEQCPLIRLCARDALEERPIGVIRAGVPVDVLRRPTGWQMAVWRAVEAGGDLEHALEGLSPHWDTQAAHRWLDRNRPWTRADLAGLPTRARQAGARPVGAGGGR